MPKSAQYTIHWSVEQTNYLFTGPQNTAVLSLFEQRERWQAWLEEHHAFAFHGRNGQLNLLKEKRSRGHEGYWYAYRRNNGRMIKHYVGRSGQVSVERL